MQGINHNNHGRSSLINAMGVDCTKYIVGHQGLLISNDVMPVLTSLQECAVVSREDRPTKPMIHPITSLAYKAVIQLLL